jgi:hypothetical protein
MHPLGRRGPLVVNWLNGAVRELDALSSRILSLCSGARTREDHAQSAWQAGAASDPAAIVAAIDCLIGIGLMRPAADLLVDRNVSAQEGARAAVDTIGIVTADRPVLGPSSLG